MMIDLPRISLRTIPIAAEAPSTTEIIADAAAITAECQKASIQFGSEKNFSYQRSEKPGGGKVRKEALLNEITITTRIGRISVAITAPARMKTVQLPQAGLSRLSSRRMGQPIRSAMPLRRLRRGAPSLARAAAACAAPPSALLPPQMNSKPRKWPATPTKSRVMTRSTTASAWRKPSLLMKSACCTMCMANIWSPGPPSRVGVMKKPSAATKTSRKPAPIPGRVSGSRMRQKVAIGPAPEACAARGSAASRRDTLE